MAATKRTSIARGVTPPTRSTSRVLETRSSFACSGERQLADLVEEDGAAAARSRAGRAWPACAPVNAPRSWPNSSLSSSVSRQRRAVEARRTARAARGDAAWMRARQHLLADAGLAEDQHADVAGRDALGERVQPPHALSSSDRGAQPPRRRCAVVAARPRRGRAPAARRRAARRGIAGATPTRAARAAQPARPARVPAGRRRRGSPGRSNS